MLASGENDLHTHMYKKTHKLYYVRRGIARNVPHIQRQTVTPDIGTHIYRHTHKHKQVITCTHTHVLSAPRDSTQ